MHPPRRQEPAVDEVLEVELVDPLLGAAALSALLASELAPFESPLLMRDGTEE
jgi:hypothetical protein